VRALPVPAHRQAAVTSRSRPEALLSAAGYFGTLAAARSLGRLGVRVVIADRRWLARARWSRRGADTLSCPDVDSSPAEFLAWLLALGAEHPGRVLYPTSDELAWMYALHREALARYFRVYVPPFDAMYTLLNKWHLHRACVALGIDVPETWLVREHDVPRVRKQARYPLVIKPQMQAFLSPHRKGCLVETADSFAPLYREFREGTSYSPIAIEQDAHVSAPLAQAFVESAARGIYGLSGFIDETGELYVARASRKVLQWPRRLGMGLCFEEAEVHPRLADDVARLCRHAGYCGAFEVEFLESRGRYQLIGVNPRFYGQMAFDVSRGLDLPRLVYLGATGDRSGLRSELEQARQTARRPRSTWRQARQE
jgi:predicted ATP-grasp superfamily ATP-dependent carboligase